MFQWLLETAGEFSDLLALLAAIGAGGLWVIRMLMAGRKQVQGLFDQTAALTEAVNDIRAQLKPNGGQSLFDRVNESAKSLSLLSEEIARIKGNQWNFAETAVDKPVWESDGNGLFIKVNHQFLNLVERDSSDVLGTGWHNIIDPVDRERIIEERADSVKYGRTFEGSFIVRSKSGKRFAVKAVSKPVFNIAGKVIAYFGRFDEVQEL